MSLATACVVNITGKYYDDNIVDRFSNQRSNGVWVIGVGQIQDTLQQLCPAFPDIKFGIAESLDLVITLSPELSPRVVLLKNGLIYMNQPLSLDADYLNRFIGGGYKERRP